MATACWAFIVAKSTPVETASLLGFCGVARLQHENSPTSYAQGGVHRLWTSWRPEKVSGNTAPTQRFQRQLYRFDGRHPGQMLSKWAPAYFSTEPCPAACGSRLFVKRTTLLPDEKTRRATRLSGHFGPHAARNLQPALESQRDVVDTGKAGAAGRNRTCDPLLRREMLYPLSYSREAGQCTQARGSRDREPRDSMESADSGLFWSM
jgi:hypothetical protein